MKLFTLYFLLVFLVGHNSHQTVADEQPLAEKNSTPIFEVSSVNGSEVNITNYDAARDPSERLTKRHLIVGSQGPWNPRAIHYEVDPRLSAVAKRWFRNTLKDFESKTCLRFREGRSRFYIDVYARRDLMRCSGTIGKSLYGKQLFSVGTKCKQPEFYKALASILGMQAEHTRSDRDKFVSVDVSKLTPWLKTFNSVKRGSTMGEPYDYRSVVHWGNNYLGKIPWSPILMKKMPGGPIIGRWENGLSELDARKINKFFGCRVSERSKPARKKDNIVLASGHCNFDYGLCNWKNWQNGLNDDQDQFDWQLATEAKKYSGPAHDHSDKKPHGKFLFFTKPSSQKENMNSGVLESPFFSGPVCLTFHFYMPNAGHVRVFIRQADSKEDNPYEQITERTGRHGSGWMILRQRISGKRKPFKIFIEGLKTPDLAGAVGLDDVFVYPGRTCKVCPGSHMTHGGHCCTFPFKYKGKLHDRCIKTDEEFKGNYWCALTSNYDQKKSGEKCTDVDNCYKNPCSSGATCVDLDFDYKCICPKHVTGKNCDVDINYCLQLPCGQHGTCVTRPRGYTCVCSKGLFGRNCEKDVDECKLGKFECGKGKCLNAPGSYKCLCDPGYTGEKCAQDVNECVDKPCLHGKCQNKSPGYSCQCTRGYTGRNCEKDLNECNTGEFDCGKTGKCQNTPGSYKCACDAGYTGPTCARDINECLENPCVHGKCQNQSPGYSCECTHDGYTGKNCDLDLDECETGKFECGDAGNCKNTVGSYKCVCLSGYKGPKCTQDINECLQNPCKHGSCKNYQGGYRCRCTRGFVGKNCDISFDKILRGNRASAMSVNHQFELFMLSAAAVCNLLALP